MEKANAKKQSPIRLFISAFIFILKLMGAILNGTFLIIFNLISSFFKKYRFSISFKVNLLYSILYTFLFYLTYFVTHSIYTSYFKDNIILHPIFQDFDLLLIIAILISLPLFLGIGHYLVTMMLTPIKDMTTKVQNINGNDLMTRLDTNLSKDELKDLAITFNQMMNRIQVYVERQKQFASDVSHELRTPLAIIQGYADMLERWGKHDSQILEESISSITEETANMNILLEKLLFLSRSDKHTLKVDIDIIDLSALCNDIIRETRFIDDSHELIPKVSPNVILKGDSALIKELIRILIDNALKYTPEGGSITLGCAATNQNIILSIKDTGIGIPKEHIPKLFERFYRVDETRNKNTGGSGLGLAIAHEIIQTHHAKVFVNSDIDEGTEFIIFFANE